jgi:hypothetical protein
MKTNIILFIYLAFAFSATAQVTSKNACIAKTITVAKNTTTETYDVFYNADKTIAGFTNKLKNDIVFEYTTIQAIKHINKVSFYEAGNLVRQITRVLNSDGSIMQEIMQEYLTDMRTKAKQFGVRNIQTFTYKNGKLVKIALEEVYPYTSIAPFKPEAQANLFINHPDLDRKRGVAYLIKPPVADQSNEMKIKETADANIFLENQNKAFAFLLINGFGATGKDVLNTKYFLGNNKLISSINSNNNTKDLYNINYKFETNCNVKYLKEVNILRTKTILVQGENNDTPDKLTLTINYACTENCTNYVNKVFYKPVAYNNEPAAENLPGTKNSITNASMTGTFKNNFELILNNNINTYDEISWGQIQAAPLCCDLITASYSSNENGKGPFVRCTDKNDGTPEYILFPNGTSVYRNWKAAEIGKQSLGHNIYTNKVLTHNVKITMNEANFGRNQIAKEAYFTLVNNMVTNVKTFKYFYANKTDPEPDSCISFENDNETVYSRIKYIRKKGNVTGAFIYNSSTKQETEYTVNVDKNKFSRFHRVYYFNYQLGIMDAKNPNLLLTVFAYTGDAITDIIPVSNTKEQPLHFDYSYIKNNAGYLSAMVGSNGIKNIFNYSCNYSKPLPNIPSPVKDSKPGDIVVAPIDTVLLPKKTGYQTPEVFDVPKNRQEILSKIYGKWLVVEYLTEKRDCNNDGIYDEVITSTQAPCKADDLIEYASNGRWIKTQNVIKCSPTAPDKYDEGTWDLSNDGKTFKVKAGIVTIMNLVIEKLTDTELVLTKTLTEVKDDKKPNNNCIIKTVYSYKKF